MYGWHVFKHFFRSLVLHCHINPFVDSKLNHGQLILSWLCQLIVLTFSHFVIRFLWGLLFLFQKHTNVCRKLSGIFIFFDEQIPVQSEVYVKLRDIWTLKTLQKRGKNLWVNLLSSALFSLSVLAWRQSKNSILTFTGVFFSSGMESLDSGECCGFVCVLSSIYN